MKDTILPGLHTWSQFQDMRRVDFNGFFWARPEGGLLVDPMPMGEDQLRFVDEHGGARWILLTNADHWRASSELKARFGAAVFAPEGDHAWLGDRGEEVDGWYADRGQLPAGLREVVEVHWVRGGKTPAEAVLYLEPLRALLFGDVVRSDRCGALRLLPDDKIADREQVVADLMALRDVNQQAVLLGDGDSLWTGARSAFLDFLRELGTGR
jgi:glyoxylase-like metal-dependent hydrolase (beta-lactamase superfamily II)